MSAPDPVVLSVMRACRMIYKLVATVRQINMHFSTRFNLSYIFLQLCVCLYVASLFLTFLYCVTNTETDSNSFLSWCNFENSFKHLKSYYAHFDSSLSKLTAVKTASFESAIKCQIWQLSSIKLDSCHQLFWKLKVNQTNLIQKRLLPVL